MQEAAMGRRLTFRATDIDQPITAPIIFAAMRRVWMKLDKIEDCNELVTRMGTLVLGEMLWE